MTNDQLLEAMGDVKEVPSIENIEPKEMHIVELLQALQTVHDRKAQIAHEIKLWEAEKKDTDATAKALEAEVLERMLAEGANNYIHNDHVYVVSESNKAVIDTDKAYALVAEHGSLAEFVKFTQKGLQDVLGKALASHCIEVTTTPTLKVSLKS